MSNAQSRASTKYNASNVKQVKINLNLRTDADIIKYLQATENVQGLIKSLIRKEMSI